LAGTVRATSFTLVANNTASFLAEWLQVPTAPPPGQRLRGFWISQISVASHPSCKPNDPWREAS